MDFGDRQQVGIRGLGHGLVFRLPADKAMKEAHDWSNLIPTETVEIFDLDTKEILATVNPGDPAPQDVVDYTPMDDYHEDAARAALPDSPLYETVLATVDNPENIPINHAVESGLVSLVIGDPMDRAMAVPLAVKLAKKTGFPITLVEVVR